MGSSGINGRYMGVAFCLSQCLLSFPSCYLPQGPGLDQLLLLRQETRAPLRAVTPTMVGCQESRGLENATCSSRTTTSVEATSTMGWTGLTLWLAATCSEATWLSRSVRRSRPR